ncbi:MAG: LptF/LptG family permease [Bacteroidetes bacterium]|nr:LptF/LptG family permease [Bacteroidota bacterium]
MKRLNFLVVKSFIGPFIVTFFVSLFVLVMQFLFMYIDDMVGKGLTFATIAKLMMYMSVTLIPMALPLAVLLSSIMTFGNLGEHFELVAFKSAGISLLKAMRPLIYMMVLLCGMAFIISNYLMPSASIKASTLLHDVRSAKPTFELKDDAFTTSMPEVIIRVSGKEKSGNKVNNILIYDHRDNRGNTKVISAESGEFYFTEDKNYVKFDLYKGASYEQVEQRTNASYPMTVMEFDKQQIVFDIGEFKFERSDESLYRGHNQMLTARELQHYIDSFESQLKIKYDTNLKFIQSYFHLSDTCFKNLVAQPLAYSKPLYIDNVKSEFRQAIIYRALESARVVKQSVNYSQDDTEGAVKQINRYKIEWHRKFTLSFAIMVLFFVGAPFGAIVKKGGLGMPMIISIFLFIIYHIISISGEKIIKENDSNVFMGMWVASFVLLPLGIYLTYKATKDAQLFNKEIYQKLFFGFISLFKIKKSTSKISSENKLP